MAYTESKFLYKVFSLDNTALTNTGNKYTWTPAKRWDVRGAVIVPTTAIGTATSAAAVVLLRWTPSGGSISTRLTCTVTAETGIGAEIAFTESTTGYTPFTMESGDTLIINTSVAMAGGTTVGVADVYLILSEKPA